ncbi:hypothetical protein RFI_35447 [Reticulomyxa filosa]|uniref:ABC transmembrane type-1 domain-containing protein n=1 Tax=Reticulomyxa filosa TaxID=46433 RepID=X6LJ80_RETFI|nr:hypothetical protein RFI_35447 [Reticulomyxa filosa]|eukprot:ETO01993.1 hypothetical protein RFI_35447 [Reticulomyxa filosa]
MLGTFLLHQYFHQCFLVGMRVTSALISACYDKALRLTASARSEHTTGNLMTIVTVDVRKIRDVFPYGWILISGPFQIVIAIYLLYQQISWTVFVGVGAQIIIMTPLQAAVATRTRKLQKEVMKIRDERIKVVNEVFGAMKIVKMYAWEISFGKKISSIRERELTVLRRYVWWGTANTLFWGWAPTMVTLSSFVAYTAAGNNLTPEAAFTSLALFGLLRFPLSMFPSLSTPISFFFGALDPTANDLRVSLTL